MAEENAKQAEPQVAETTTTVSLLEEIMRETPLSPKEEGYEETKRGIAALVQELVKPTRAGERANKVVVDQMIAEVDKKLGEQVDEILHHPDFQNLESAWRGVYYVIKNTNFRENIKVEIFSASKEDLLDDFEDNADITKSGLYKQIYTAEYGQFGGEPVGAMIGNYYFTPGSQDIKLLQYTASVSAMAHCPFIASAGSQFFGKEDFLEFPNLKDVKALLEGAKFAKWHSFRENEDSRYVGLTLPRFLLRAPYRREDNPVKSFLYDENVHESHQHYLWGNAAFAMATRITDSFAKYRWCPNIIGPQSGGAVEDLPVHTFESMGRIEAKIPTEILVSDRREYELAEEGFIALTMRKSSDNAAFFSANSVQLPKYYGLTKEGKEAETNYKLGTQLPYMFIISRLAHYIKVIQREHIGSWKERTDLEQELNQWIRQYVSDQENPPQDVRSRKPLRKAKIEVTDVEGDPGWYRVNLSVRPHFKYMGANFTLSLVGKLDKD